MLLKELKTDGSLVFISHDMSVVRVLCDRVLVMSQSEVVKSGRCAELFANPEHVYTRALLDAIPVPDFDLDGLCAASRMTSCKKINNRRQEK